MYSESADLNLSDERLVELIDNANTPGVPDLALLAKLGTRANGRVDSYLSQFYVTPVAAPPQIVVDVEAAIWKYLLYTHREVMEVPAAVLKEYDWAMAQLEAWRTAVDMLDAPARTQFVGATVL